MRFASRESALLMYAMRSLQSRTYANGAVDLTPVRFSSPTPNDIEYAPAPRMLEFCRTVVSLVARGSCTSEASVKEEGMKEWRAKTLDSGKHIGLAQDMFQPHTYNIRAFCLCSRLVARVLSPHHQIISVPALGSQPLLQLCLLHRVPRLRVRNHDVGVRRVNGNRFCGRFGE